MNKTLQFFIALVAFGLVSCNDGQDSEKNSQTDSEKKQSPHSEETTLKNPFTLGEAAHIAIGTENAEESAAFYEKLGFERIEDDTIPYPWVRMTDGCVIININQDSMEYMGMTYFTANPKSIFNRLDSLGCEYFAKIPGEDGSIQQVIIQSPDSALGFSVIAHDPSSMKWPSTLNMSAMMEDSEMTVDESPNALCGMFGEFAAPVEDLERSIAYWKDLGFDVIHRANAGYPFAIVTDGLTIFGLHQTDREEWTYPALTYFRGDTEGFKQKLIEAGIDENSIQELEEYPGNYDISTPEGQHIFLFEI